MALWYFINVVFANPTRVIAIIIVRYILLHTILFNFCSCFHFSDSLSNVFYMFFVSFVLLKYDLRSRPQALLLRKRVTVGMNLTVFH
jgi:hypothetical protein